MCPPSQWVEAVHVSFRGWKFGDGATMLEYLLA